MTKDLPYDPLDKNNLGRSVAEALLSAPLVPIEKLVKFNGAGVYAIYYAGSLPFYAPIKIDPASSAEATPIYVGKADAAGGRKGVFDDVAAVGAVLYRRILKHRDSLERAENLLVSDFYVRKLVVDDIWIPLGESLLIARFRPIWNVFVDGFGNNDPGSRRYEGERPRWDTLHPGRPWAAKCTERKETAEQIAAEIAAYLSK